MVKSLSVALVNVLLSFAVNAQVVGVLLFDDQEQQETCFQSPVSFDTVSVFRNFSRCISTFHHQGYLEARIDSISIFDGKAYAFGYLGGRYQWATITADSLSKSWFQLAGISPSSLIQQPVSSESLGALASKTIGHLEDEGYPFASIQFSNINITENRFFADIQVNPGPLILLDTLYLLGDVRISRRFIESYLGFEKGAKYRESEIATYDNKLRTLPFADVIKPLEVEFTPGRARIYTYIANQRANRFSGWLGFTANPDQTPRLRLNGDVQLVLSNIFNLGEVNSLQWQAFEQGTQRLKLSSVWHYLFGTRVGVSSQFNLYRRDSSYININPKFDVRFPFSSWEAGFGIDLRASKAISTDGGLGSTSTLLYTVSLGMGQPLQQALPTRGFWTHTAFGVGHRSEEETSNQLDYSSVVGEVAGKLVGYYPIHSNLLVAKVDMNGRLLAHINSAESAVFFENEIYRIGGFGSLRGFNQESILTPAYIISTVEMQLRMAGTINTYLFFDQGLVKGYDNPDIQVPFGTGFGIQIASAGGLVNISYALGNGMGESMKFSNAKIHLGFTASF
jgi:outer membrane protein assembly factor BamA